MKLADYSPTFRNVLLKEVEILQTKGGIFLPSTEYANEENTKLYTVIKPGKDCLEVKVNDVVKIMKGIFPESFRLDDGTREDDFYQVMEQQIIGYFRQK